MKLNLNFCPPYSVFHNFYRALDSSCGTILAENILTLFQKTLIYHITIFKKFKQEKELHKMFISAELSNIAVSAYFVNTGML